MITNIGDVGNNDVLVSFSYKDYQILGGLFTVGFMYLSLWFVLPWQYNVLVLVVGQVVALFAM